MIPRDFITEWRAHAPWVLDLQVEQDLGICRQRFFHLGPMLELFCTSASAWRAPPQSFDLIHAALIFEYLHPEPLVAQIAGWLADHGTASVVLQLPGGEGPAPAPK